MPLAFDLQNVSFAYEGVNAIRSLSLQIERGDRIALLGANGSGKSTLLKLLDALCFPARGQITFLGCSLTQERLRNDSAAIEFRRRVGLVFQNPDAQLFNSTVLDEVAFGPLQMEWPKEEIVRRVNDTLEFMGISHLRERSPYRLSGGEKKRVALASVVVLDPDVLLLDEPTATLDPTTASQVVDLIHQWKGTVKTIVTATHQLDIVEDIADRAVVLEKGTIIADASPSEILSNSELLLRANLTHAHRHSHGGVTHSHPHSHPHAHSHEPE